LLLYGKPPIGLAKFLKFWRPGLTVTYLRPPRGIYNYPHRALFIAGLIAGGLGLIIGSRRTKPARLSIYFTTGNWLLYWGAGRFRYGLVAIDLSLMILSIFAKFHTAALISAVPALSEGFIRGLVALGLRSRLAANRPIGMSLLGHLFS